MVNTVFSHDLGITRDILIKSFKDKNIDARVFFWPLSSLDFIDSHADTPVAKDLPNRSINIPSFHEITDKEQSRVVDVIKQQISLSLK